MTILHHQNILTNIFTHLTYKHTLQNILKFQNVKFECLHSYIGILNESENKALFTLNYRVQNVCKNAMTIGTN